MDASISKRFATANRPTLSFEFFPPKNSEGEEVLWATVESLSKFGPDFASVTYGAMGSNQELSLDVVKRLSALMPVVAHLTCVGATKENISELLDHYKGIGVAGVLALRGDRPEGSVGGSGDYEVALDLVRHIRADTLFDVGVATFPEKHPESPSLDHDIRVLKIKQDAGALFAMTQLFFDFESYQTLVEKASLAGVSIPIVPGIMPIANVGQVLRMASMSGAKVPRELENDLSNASALDAPRIGMDFSINLTRKLIDFGVPGIHVFTLNQSRAAIELVSGAGLA